MQIAMKFGAAKKEKPTRNLGADNMVGAHRAATGLEAQGYVITEKGDDFILLEGENEFVRIVDDGDDDAWSGLGYD